LLFFPNHGRYGGQLISGPVALQIVDRLGRFIHTSWAMPYALGLDKKPWEERLRQ